MTNTTITTANGPAIVSSEKQHGRTRWTVETLDATATFVPRMPSRRTSEWLAATRVYSALDAFTDAAWDDREAELVRDAVRRETAGELTGKCPTLAAHQRVGLKLARAGLEATLPELLAALRGAGRNVVVPAEFVARWSLRAGCSMCPCSPGHVLSFRLLIDGSPYDVYFRR